MARKRFDVITIGGAVRDVSFYTSGGQVISTPQNLTAQRMLAFEYGAKIGIHEAHFSLGGGASNAAVSFRRLGFATGIIARVGKDENGQQIIQNYKKEKIATHLVQHSAKDRSGLSFVLSHDRKEREHIIFAFRGANDGLQLTPKVLQSLQASWAYVTSLSGDRWQQNLNNLAKSKKKIGCKIAWNPGARQLSAGKRALTDFLKKTDVLILNKDEAIELALSGLRVGKRNPSYLNRPLYLLNILYDWGPKIVVVTLGSKGAWAFDGTKVYKRGVAKAKVVDTCGVGDSFGSSFVAGLHATEGDIAKAMKWGMINSASVISEHGAQNGLLSRKELLRKI